MHDEEKKMTKFAALSYKEVHVMEAESKRIGRTVYSGIEAPIHEVSDRHRHYCGWEKYGVTNV